MPLRHRAQQRYWNIGIGVLCVAFVLFVGVALLLFKSAPVANFAKTVSDRASDIDFAYADAPQATMSLSAAAITELTGEATLDAAGIVTVSAGDVNNDGYADILIASKANDDTGLNAGAAYLVYGRSSTLTSGSLGGGVNTVVEFTGETAGDYAGTAVSSAGDVNGDGYDDILIGAYQPGPGVGPGFAYLIYGQGTAFASTMSLADSSIVKFTGESMDDKAGAKVSSAGDVNNDGFDDIMFAAPGDDDVDSNAGASYLVYGQSGALSSVNLSTAIKFTGEAASDNSGSALASGDFNNDGYSDMLISSNAYAANNLGRTYLLYGQSTPRTSMNLGDASIPHFTGEGAEDASGVYIASAGDLNNDGYDDILIGASLNDDAGADAGAAYLIYGQSSALTSSSLSTAIEFTGEVAGDNAGISVSSAGDLNNDGYDDLLIGAVFNDDGGADAGAAYLIYGKSASLPSASLSTAFEFTGEAAGDRAGMGVASAGDVNADGHNDILIGSRLNDDGATDAGATYIVYYQPPFVSLTTSEQNASEMIGAVTVTAQISSVFSDTVSVPFTVSGTAIGGGVDSTITDGTITIPVGTLSGDCVFTVIDDSSSESSETIIITLGTPSFGTLLGTIQQTITIADNDKHSSNNAPDLALTAEKTISIISPTLGSSIAGGSTTTVAWSSTGIIPVVSVFLSVDGGTQWMRMSQNIENIGIASFAVPDLATQHALIKIEGSDLSTVLATQISEEFSIDSLVPGIAESDSAAEAAYRVSERVFALPSSVAINTLVKLADDGDPDTRIDSIVYSVGADGYRHAFPNASVFLSWYSNLHEVTIIKPADLARIPLGPNVTYKPGSRLVKFEFSSRLYVVDRFGVLRLVPTEDVAIQLYGFLWKRRVDVISDTFFGNYSFGPDIKKFQDFYPGVFSSLHHPSDSMRIPGYTI